MLLLVVLGLLFLIHFTGGRGELTPPEDALLAFFAPVQESFSSLGKRIQSFFDAVASFQQLNAENERLRHELAFLEGQLLELKELQKENHRYRQLLNFKQESGIELLPAEVIARDPSRWFGTITINRGYLDDVRSEMAVVTDRGLVGMVSMVSANSSQVILLTDPRLAVSAVVQRSREPGMVGIVESYPDAPVYLRMTNLPPDANIQPGDSLITLGIGGIFPKGLHIGTVKEVNEDLFGLLLTALIEPRVNFNRLEEVMVVLDHEQTGLEEELAGNTREEAR